MERIEVRAETLMRGRSRNQVWDLVLQWTVDPSCSVTNACAPHFLDTEDHGVRRSGLRRDLEQTRHGVRLILTRWVECESHVSQLLRGHHTDEVGEKLSAFQAAVRRAVEHGAPRLSDVSR